MEPWDLFGTTPSSVMGDLKTNHLGMGRIRVCCWVVTEMML